MNKLNTETFVRKLRTEIPRLTEEQKAAFKEAIQTADAITPVAKMVQETQGSEAARMLFFKALGITMHPHFPSNLFSDLMSAATSFAVLNHRDWITLDLEVADVKDLDLPYNLTPKEFLLWGAYCGMFMTSYLQSEDHAAYMKGASHE